MQSMSLVEINSSIMTRCFDSECHTNISYLIKVPHKLTNYIRTETLNNEELISDFPL